MDRSVSLTTSLKIADETAVALLNRKAAALLDTPSVDVELGGYEHGGWSIVLAARGRSAMPHFAGQLAVTDGALTLTGSYRLRGRSDDIVGAHLAACDALEGFVEDAASRIAAAAKSKPAPMSIAADYAEDFRQRHGVSA